MVREPSSGTPAKATHEIYDKHDHKDQSERPASKERSTKIESAAAEQKQKYKQQYDNIHVMDYVRYSGFQPWGVTRL